MRKFVALEKELNLFSHSYDGFFYWQQLRFTVCEALFGNRIANENAASEKNKKPVLKKIARYACSVADALRVEWRLLKGTKSELIFLREPLSSDKFLDSWELPAEISRADYRCVPYFKGRKAGELFLENARIQSVIEKRLRKVLRMELSDSNEKRFLKMLENRLKNDFGQTLSADKMETLIRDLYIWDKNYSRLFSRIFRRSGCRAIAFINYYSTELISALKAAEKNNVTSIELQHGVINNHEEYWFEDNRGLHNYVPDCLLTFGEIHNSWIKPVRGKKAEAVGFPFQEKSLKALSNVLPDEKAIMIYPESDPGFEKLLNEFIDRITPLGYHVYIKLHPLHSENASLWYPLLSNNKNAELIIDQSKGIYYWLKTAKHHIMASTTVGLEAVAMDHPNVCIALTVPHDQVQCLIDWNIARGFSSAEELIRLVLEPLDMNNSQAMAARKRLWKDNGSENMTAFFRRLKKNGWRI